MKTGTLRERLLAALEVPLEVALQALARQAGQPIRPCLWKSATALHMHGGTADADLLKQALDPQPFQTTPACLPLLEAAPLAALLRGRPRLHGGGARGVVLCRSEPGCEADQRGRIWR